MLVPTVAVVVLIIETGFASAERRIEKRLLRRSHDLRANLDAIRKGLDAMQAAGAQDPQASLFAAALDIIPVLRTPPSQP